MRVDDFVGLPRIIGGSYGELERALWEVFLFIRSDYCAYIEVASHTI
jgi:hypothetical protein